MTRCPVVDGWQSRVLSKLGLAVASGLTVGALLAILRQGPPVRYSLATAASFAICEGTFCGFQELTRLLRCDVSPINSVFGGAAAGYVLTSLYEGKQKAVPVAIICAATCGAADVIADRADFPALWQNTLVKLDLLDAPPGHMPPSAEPAQTQENTSTAIAAEGFRNEDANFERLATEESRPMTWRDLMPIHKLSEEEWAQYKRRQAQDFQARIDKMIRPKPPESGG